MLGTIERRWVVYGFLVCAFLAAAFHAAPARADRPERTDMYVVVKDAGTDQPIFQARITLRFKVNPGKLKRAKTLSYSAKTNAQGRYKFVDIPKGPVYLIVTAERHQTYGEELELEQDDQVFEVKLKKPQPLL